MLVFAFAAASAAASASTATATAAVRAARAGTWVAGVSAARRKYGEFLRQLL